MVLTEGTGVALRRARGGILTRARGMVLIEARGVVLSEVRVCVSFLKVNKGCGPSRIGRLM